MEIEVLLKVLGVVYIVGGLYLWGYGLCKEIPEILGKKIPAVLAALGIITIIWGGDDPIGYMKVGGLIFYVVGGLILLNKAVDIKSLLLSVISILMFVGGFGLMFLSVIVAHQ